jgi:hypothetical protein
LELIPVSALLKSILPVRVETHRAVSGVPEEISTRFGVILARAVETDRGDSDREEKYPVQDTTSTRS